MPVLAAFAVFSVVGMAAFGLLYLGGRLAGDEPQKARDGAAYLSVGLMLPFFILTLLVAWIQWLAFSAPVW